VGHIEVDCVEEIGDTLREDEVGDMGREDEVGMKGGPQKR
jgi:hypothetical protein